jgi:hypothetical protein
VTIGSFSYEVLLNIFRYYLNASPQYWPRLVHICRKWRRIVFDSQRALHLRLFCTRGMPVLKALDCWPALRIVVHHGARRASAPYPLAPEDEDNVVAALKHSDRVSSISLAVTSSLLEKLSTIERPFSELESLVLRPQVGTWMTLPSTFRWGRRLRALRLTKLNIPALPELLSLSTSLLELRLLKIPQYFSLDTFAHALSGMTQLRTLSLQFRSFTPCPDSLGLLPQSRERAVLPALTRLKYQGTSEYLDNLMARIDAPCLNVVQITFFCRSLMRALQLGRFIDRIQAQNSRAEILFSARAITITFTPPENPKRLELQVSGDSLPQQLSCMAQILKTSPAFLLGVGHLCIRELHPSSAPDYIDRTRWWELFRTFRGIKWVQIVAGQHSRNIVLALRLRKCEAAFPALHKLCIGGPLRDCSPFRKAVESFIHSRRLSGHNIGVEYEQEINELRRSGVTFLQSQTITLIFWA